MKFDRLAGASALSEPRIAPVEPQNFDPIVQQILDPGKRPAAFGEGEQPIYNVFRTLANYPALMKRMSPWGNHLLFKSSLPAREREILILRTGWRCQAAYEWAHHRRIGLDEAGLTESDLSCIRAGRFPAPEDQVLLTAVDELLDSRFLSDTTWGVLAHRFENPQLMDLVFTVGHYASMCAALNSFGVQLEPEYEGAA